MIWPSFRLTRQDRALLDYWDDVVRRQPAKPVPPADVPADLAPLVRTIQATAAAARPRSYQDELLQRLLATYEETNAMHATSATAVLSPSRKPPHAPAHRAPISHWPRSVVPALNRTLQVALVLLLILASVAGIWLAGSHDDDRARLAAPATPVATTTPEATAGWTHWRGDATRSGVTNFGPVNQPVELWRYDASADCGPVPTVAGDTVYVACLQGGLNAVARATGELRWTFTAEPFDAFFDGPHIAGDLAYVVGEDSGSLYAVDIATGEERWRYAEAWVIAAPAVADGMALVNTAEGFLIRLDAVTGEERWRTTIPTGGEAGNAAILDGMAYVGSASGNLAAVDVATGAIVWQVDTGDERNGIAVVAGGIVYVGAGSVNGSIGAYDAETGALLWQRDEPMLSPSVANGVGYSGSDDGIVYAFDAASGEELWQAQVGGSANPVAIGGDIIYVPSVSDNAIYALDAATGDELWHVTLDGEPSAQASVVDGAMYVVTRDGVIQAFAEPAPGSATPQATPVA